MLLPLLLVLFTLLLKCELPALGWYCRLFSVGDEGALERPFALA